MLNSYTPENSTASRDDTADQWQILRDMADTATSQEDTESDPQFEQEVLESFPTELNNTLEVFDHIDTTDLSRKIFFDDDRNINALARSCENPENAKKAHQDLLNLIKDYAGEDVTPEQQTELLTGIGEEFLKRALKIEQQTETNTELNHWHNTSNLLDKLGIEIPDKSINSIGRSLLMAETMSKLRDRQNTTYRDCERLQKAYTLTESIGAELSSDIINQMSVELLKRTLDAEQQANIGENHDFLQNTCTFLDQAGVQLPLPPTQFTVAFLKNDDDFKNNLHELGLINDECVESVYQSKLQEHFNELHKMPEALTDPTSPAREYWRKESEKLGLDDALEQFLSYGRGYGYRFSSGVDVSSWIDPQGYPSESAFMPNSPLLKDAFSLYEQTGKPMLRFTQEHIDKIPSTVDRVLVQASMDADLDDDEQYYQFCRDASHLRNNDTYVDEWHEPTDAFWAQLCFSEAPYFRKACLEAPESNLTEVQKAYLDLDEQVRADMGDYLDYTLWGKRFDDDLETDKLATLNTVFKEPGKLADDFYNQHILGCNTAEKVAADFPEQLPEHFSAEEIAYLKIPEAYRTAFCEFAGYDKTGYGVTRRCNISGLIPKFFDKDGAKSDFFLELFDAGEYGLLASGAIPIEDMHLEEHGKTGKQVEDILKAYPQELSEEEQRSLNAILQKIDFDRLENPEAIKDTIRLAMRVYTSNAIELRRSSENFLNEITKTENSDDKLDRIEEIFLHNNLPHAAKTFKTFQVLHPATQNFGFGYLLHPVSNRGILGQLPEQGIRSKETVFFTDLMKASIDSNSRSMRAWIKQMRSGDPKYLSTAYRQTPAGHANPEGSFAATKRYSEADRAVRSFGYMLGLKGLDDLENRMDQKVAEADAKGRERYAKNDFRIESGDLVKAINEEYIGNMLQNGILCKEFLDGEANSDSTPLDADLTIIGDGVDSDVSSAIAWKNQHASFGTMRVNLVMKGDDRFVSEQDETKYDPEKFAVWQNGEDHGIRVGFPSSAIDFITFDTMASHADDKTFLFQEIAKNGFYIPVVDQNTGECIFSPDDFDALRQKLSGLEFYDGGEYQFATDEDLANSEIGELAKNMLDDQEQTAVKRSAINAEIGKILSAQYPEFRGLKSEADGDLTPGFFELIDTGSTGRGTNVPGSKADFDFIMRVDSAIYNNSKQKAALEQLLRQKLKITEDKSTSNGLRLKDVQIEGIEDPVDIDISLVQRTNRMEFSTDQAVRERIETMFQQDPARAQLTLANIVQAKKLLKAANVYKPQHSSDTNDSDKKGGLGGVGVENWILQNGGSLKVAAQNFLAAAERAEGDFEKFKAEYPIWDAGQNHFSVRDNEQRAEVVGGSSSYKIPYDNFVTRNMSESGFARMVTALQNYLANLETA